MAYNPQLWDEAKRKCRFGEEEIITKKPWRNDEGFAIDKTDMFAYNVNKFTINKFMIN